MNTKTPNGIAGKDAIDFLRRIDLHDLMVVFVAAKTGNHMNYDRLPVQFMQMVYEMDIMITGLVNDVKGEDFVL